MKICFVIVYLVLIILLIINFREFIAKKARLTPRRTAEQAEQDNNITKMIIASGVVYSFSMVFYATGQAIGLLEKIADNYIPTFIIIRFTMFVLSIANLCIGDLVILYYDRRIKDKLREIFRCQRI